MRIALVSMHTSPSAVPGSGDAGGMNVVVAEAAAALAARGHEVVVVTRATRETAAGEYPLTAGPRTTEPRTTEPRTTEPGTSPTLVALEAGDPGLRKERLPGAVREFARGLRALAGTRGFDAIHAHYWLSGLAAREAFAQRGGRIAVTFHTIAAQKNANLAEGDAPEPETRLAGERLLAAESFVVAGSRSELRGVIEGYGEPPLGSAVVHPGVDTELFRPRAPAAHPGAAPHHSATDQSPAHRITVLGRVQPLKGQDLAVRAAIELARRDPELFARTEWVIAGEPTPGAEDYAAGLRALAAQHGVADRLRFLPAQSRREAAALLASSSLVLVPSHSETFGLTALEASACGVPVIAAGHTGLVEAVPDGVAGRHLSDRDPANWAAAIAELLRDGARRARLGSSARAHAERHDWRAHAAQLERCYARLAG
ncbi:glycosyltransferase [Leucobacter albus]|uniref:D-inositol 3-phosphate glycosyltransferase n=1 Tax=Leucobacter albus TaxID=272210 RepID=A0ABW3TRI6_9MICO